MKYLLIVLAISLGVMSCKKEVVKKSNELAGSWDLIGNTIPVDIIFSDNGLLDYPGNEQSYEWELRDDTGVLHLWTRSLSLTGWSDQGNIAIENESFTLDNSYIYQKL